MSRISKLKDSCYHIDFDEKEVFCGKERVARIQARHLNVLEVLARNAGRLTKKEVIMDSCFKYTSDSSYYNAFTHIRNHIHEKVGESIEKCSGGFRYLGGPITEEDIERIDSGEAVITDKEEELLYRVAKYKIHKRTGREIDAVLHQDLEIIVATIISGITEATWKEYTFNKKVQEVLETYDVLQMTYENEPTLSL